MKNRQMVKLFSLVIAMSLTAASIHFEAPVRVAFAAEDIADAAAAETAAEDGREEAEGNSVEEETSETGNSTEPAKENGTALPEDPGENSTGESAEEEEETAGEGAGDTEDAAEEEGAATEGTAEETEETAAEEAAEETAEASTESPEETAEAATGDTEETVETAAEDTGAETASTEDTGETEEDEEDSKRLSRLRLAKASASTEDTEAEGSSWGADSEDPLLLASAQPDFFALIDTNDTAKTSDSEYSFTITPNEKSKLTYWVDDGYADKTCLVHTLTSLQHESTVPIYSGQALGIVPQDDALSGHFGVWITNAGSYWGTDIDVKITVRFSGYTAALSKSSEEEATIYPILLFSLRQDGLLGVDTEDLGCTLTYELFKKDESGNETPVSLNMCLNFGDIDGNQTYGFRVNSGSINGKPQVMKDGCEVYARVPGSVSDASDSSLNSYWWLISSWHSDYQTEPYAPGEVRFELRNTQGFDIVYGSWMAYSYPELHDNRYQVNQYENLTRNFGYSVDRYRYCCEMVESGSFRALSLNKLNDPDSGKNLCRMNISYFTSYSFLPYDLPVPKKTVTDSDETGVTENTIARPWETLTYEITQSIPKERPEYRYSSYEMTDVLPEGIAVCTKKTSSGSTVPDVTVTNVAGTDVTSCFSVARSGQKITISAGTNARKSSSFYNNRFTITIRAALTEQAQEDPPADDLVNAAEAAAKGQGTYEQTSNRVTTRVGFSVAHPTITITKKIDRAIASFGQPSFLFRITGKDNGLSYTVCIPIPEGETQGTRTIAVKAGDKGAPEQYTITELPVGRYRLKSVLPAAWTAMDETTGLCTATVSDVYGSAGSTKEPQNAGVTFFDTLSYTGRCSHTDTRINTVRQNAPGEEKVDSRPPSLIMNLDSEGNSFREK